jgi:hypothetical protein
LSCLAGDTAGLGRAVATQVCLAVGERREEIKLNFFVLVSLSTHQRVDLLDAEPFK